MPLYFMPILGDLPMKKNHLVIAFALTAILIDTMGVGLIFPLLPDLFLSAHSPILSAGLSHTMREFLYGVSIACWAGGIFFGAPFLGELSDRYGRKWVLTLSLAMVALSYFFSWGSLFVGSGFLFLLSRLINGFFSSSFPLAQAIIIDASSESERARNLGWVVLAASIGFLFGPLLGAMAYAIVGAAHGPEWTFFSAALLSFCNTLGIYFWLGETDQVRSHRPINLLSVVTTCRFVFIDPRVRVLTLLFLLLQIAWGIYIQAIPVVLSEKFQQAPEAVSLFYAVIGSGFLVMTLWIQPRLFKHFKVEHLCIVSLALQALIMGVVLCAKTIQVEWIMAFLLSMVEGLCYTGMTMLFSNAVNNDEQGRVMGGAGAIFGLVWALLGLSLGAILHVGLLVPIMIALVALSVNTLLFFGWRR
jgi:DHA1 family tetracycline resistance protein-like MFS transporter